MRRTTKGYVQLFLRYRHLQSQKRGRVIHSGIGEQETGKGKEGWNTADRGTLRNLSQMFRKIQSWAMNDLVENKGN